MLVFAKDARSDNSARREGGASMSARGKALHSRAKSIVCVACVHGASVYPRAGSVVDVASKYGASQYSSTLCPGSDLVCVLGFGSGILKNFTLASSWLQFKI